MLTFLLYNQKRQWQPRTAFSKTKLPELFALPQLRTTTSFVVAVTYFVGLRPHTARLRSWNIQETLATGVTAPFHSVVLVEEKQGGGRINTHHPVHARR